jgi:hypothetical protein
VSHPGSAPCPQGFDPGQGGPASVVVVEIISVKPNTDLEGDDDFIPFYDNHADIYGFVTIDGETFDLPQIEETDFPHWEATGPRKGVFEKAVSSSPVPISIDIWEGDSGLTGDDDHVDINPLSGKRRLDFAFDLCALTLTGDINEPSQGLHQISGGSGDEAATITFRVSLKDARPVSQNDLALVDLDLIQVVPRTSRLVARKGTVVMVLIANNHPVTINSTIRIRISGGSFAVDETFPLQIKAGEVQKRYLFADHPIAFPAAQTSYPVAVVAEVVDPGSAGLPSGDCRLGNDRFTNRTTWKVVTTDPNFSLLWAKVGSLLDVGNYVPDSHFDEIFELGTAYIRAVYPLIGPISTQLSVDIPPPPVTAAADFVVSILSSFGLPVDAVEPVVLTFELNGVAALLPQSRLMGVLPNKDWFRRFSAWSDVTGFSLGEFMPRAVIFLPRDESGSTVGPMITLPAHELGHTFGLSVDSRLKTSWVCDIDWPVVGHAACGLVGGFDEYNHDDPNLQDGNPASGYWVKRGGEPPPLDTLADQEQCDSHCLMGNSPVNAHTNWPALGRWIDPADYDRLIDKLVIHPDPEVVYVSGMISWHNQIYLGRCVRLDAGLPDHSGARGMYGFRFLNEAGRLVSEVGLPVAWNHAEFKRVMPITFFGVTLELPRSAAKLEIWNRGTGTCLASLELDRSVPEVYLDRPERHGKSSVVLDWKAHDKERSRLSYDVLVSTDGEQWGPIAYGLTESKFVVDTTALASGEYRVEVLALNSIRVGRSNQVTFRVERDHHPPGGKEPY